MKGEVDSDEDIWQAIEADREAIRAEMREELLTKRFDIGERVQYRSPVDSKWITGTVVVVADNTAFKGSDGSLAIRRPPKKRAMSNAEMAEELHKTGCGELNSQLEYLDGDTLKRLCDVLNIHTEVEE